MTAYPSTELTIQAMKLSAIDYLIKPVDLERLIQETFLEGKVDIGRARAYFYSKGS